MKKVSLTMMCALGSVALLSACGGGGGASGVMGVTSQNLIGVNATTGADPQVVTLVQTTATAGDGLSADFDGYIFEADSGFENGSAVENGNSIGLLTQIDLPTPTDLRLFDGVYDDGDGVKAIYYGVSGIAPSESLPSSGTATWTGSGFAELVSDDGTDTLGIGTATITASFPGGLSATLTGLSGDVDMIEMESLTITGDRFSGSSVATSKSGSSVNVVGGKAVGAVDGILSGSQTAAGVPDEVGGLFSLTGSDATLIGGFVGD